jgi:peptide/nickel transport system permease protein
MRYIIRRLLQAIVVVFGVSVAAFGMSFLTGDPTEVILGDGADRMTVAQIQEFRTKMGFDRPWYIQYISFVGKALQGDFGYSFIRHKPAYEVIAERLPATIRLAAFAFVLSIVFAIPFGVVSATRAHSLVDYAVTVMALVGQSIPSFWLGILLILLFGVDLRWLPISGSGTWQHLIMPGITLSAFSIARNMRLTRSSMLDYMQRDFVRNRALQGAAREPRHLCACAAQFPVADRNRHRAGDRLSTRRLGSSSRRSSAGRASAARSSPPLAPRISTSCRPVSSCWR